MTISLIQGLQVKRAAHANNEFAHAFLQTRTEGNLAVSPFSISLVAAMVFLGASGETADQLAKVFGFEGDAAEQFGRLADDIFERAAQAGIDASLANDIWVQQDFEIGESYLAALSRRFDARPRHVDFENAPEKARETINAYVGEQTRGHIESLIPEGAIFELTRMVLTNALYIWAEWADKFDRSDTKEKVFHAPDGDVEVPMMEKDSREFRRATVYGIDAVELPYQDDDLAALIILPGRGRIRRVERTLDARVFGSIVDQTEESPLILEMPRFKMRYKQRLASTLQEMGVSRLFRMDAELNQIHPELAVDEAVHETALEVNEEGTRVASASAVQFWMSGKPEYERLIVDRPFLFYVYDRRTRAILLTSRVLDPS
jgi:serpin B